MAPVLSLVVFLAAVTGCLAINCHPYDPLDASKCTESQQSTSAFQTMKSTLDHATKLNTPETRDYLWNATLEIYMFLHPCLSPAQAALQLFFNHYAPQSNPNWEAEMTQLLRSSSNMIIGRRRRQDDENHFGNEHNVYYIYLKAILDQTSQHCVQKLIEENLHMSSLFFMSKFPTFTVPPGSQTMTTQQSAASTNPPSVTQTTATTVTTATTATKVTSATTATKVTPATTATKVTPATTATKVTPATTATKVTPATTGTTQTTTGTTQTTTASVQPTATTVKTITTDKTHPTSNAATSGVTITQSSQATTHITKPPHATTLSTTSNPNNQNTHTTSTQHQGQTHGHATSTLSSTSTMTTKDHHTGNNNHHNDKTTTTTVASSQATNKPLTTHTTQDPSQSSNQQTTATTKGQSHTTSTTVKPHTHQQANSNSPTTTTKGSNHNQHSTLPNNPTASTTQLTTTPGPLSCYQCTKLGCFSAHPRPCTDVDEMCFVHVTDHNGHRDISRGCRKKTDCASVTDLCNDLTHAPVQVTLDCTFCCNGSGCNKPPGLIPDADTLYFVMPPISSISP